MYQTSTYKWKCLQHALSRYVFNSSLYVIFTNFSHFMKNYSNPRSSCDALMNMYVNNNHHSNWIKKIWLLNMWEVTE